jgi:hypothetical protein
MLMSGRSIVLDVRGSLGSSGRWIESDVRGSLGVLMCGYLDKIADRPYRPRTVQHEKGIRKRVFAPAVLLFCD